MIDALVGLLGGGVIGVVAKAARDAYVARQRNVETLAKVDAERARREDEVTGAIVIEERSDRRRMESEIKSLRDQVTHLSVDLARCEERHRLTEERLGDLETKLDLAMQLVERQKTQIDNLVRAALERDSIPPVRSA